MSHYRKISIEIKHGESAVAALRDLGLHPEVSADLHDNSMTLHTHWRSFGAQSQQVAIAVQKEDLKGVASGYVMDGLGLSWNGTGYDLVQDGLGEGFINQIKQRYAYHEAMRLAVAQGYAVREEAGADGTIRLVCSRYNPSSGYGY